MCGISAIAGRDWQPANLAAMMAAQHHRGPDADGVYHDPDGCAGLGHNRLSIIDLSNAGRQPMADATGRYWLVFNGEIYNYLELRRELESSCSFRTHTDSEVLLAAYARWGPACLDRLLGMFAFAIWDEQSKRLFAARDRFGVKPLYFHQAHGSTLYLASEIKALWAAGIARGPDEVTWATYLVHGLCDHSARTFWQGVVSLPAGHMLTWAEGEVHVAQWYDLAERSGQALDARSDSDALDEYAALLTESVRLRFRADVPVGINLSGGVDSSTLLGLVRHAHLDDEAVRAFTFVTGDPAYDELPWARQMLEHTHHPLVICRLAPGEVPALAESVQTSQDEPFGGLPTLAYARLFESARSLGTIVLLDGQGLDEQWAGYDYYGSGNGAIVQGTVSSAVRPNCLQPAFSALAQPFEPPAPFADLLRNQQHRDARYTKLPRALRFNDRVSMRASTELREPFLDHRLFELALRQPPDRKIANRTRKRLLRQIARQLLPQEVVEAPKRALQTPQREWLRGPLRDWAEAMMGAALGQASAWLRPQPARQAWHEFLAGRSDNSFFVWQWISVALCSLPQAARATND
jgi:asparagine synthase (glutamine-hydrolysing)